MHEAARILGRSFITALPVKVGDIVSNVRVERIDFEMAAYMRGGKWYPGYAAMGYQMIGQTQGSARKRLVFELSGLPANLSQQ